MAQTSDNAVGGTEVARGAGLPIPWFTVSLAIWAVVASIAAAYYSASLTKAQNERRVLMRQTFKVSQLYMLRAFNEGVGMPISTFDPWLPMAVTTGLAEGGTEYQFTLPVGNTLEGAAFLVVDATRDGCVQKMYIAAGEF